MRGYISCIFYFSLNHKFANTVIRSAIRDIPEKDVITYNSLYEIPKYSKKSVFAPNVKKAPEVRINPFEKPILCANKVKLIRNTRSIVSNTLNGLTP